MRDNTVMSETLNPAAEVAANPVLAKHDDNLVWLDCEMTGLDPEKERIIEIAVIVTSPDLAVRVPGPVLVIHQSQQLLDGMDAWNKGTHGRSGLIDKVKASSTTEADAEKQILAFLRKYVSKGKSPMCGNTIGQDRRFLVKAMPKLEAYFHYRNLDVSTLKELAKRWHPAVAKGVVKKGAHQALDDIIESIEEMKYYRAQFLKLPQ